MSKPVSYFDLTKSFKKKDFAPLYLLHGEEEYFIDELTHTIEQTALEESERAFNQTIVYGRDAQPSGIMDMAARLPMMATRQVIVIREAQEMRDLNGMSPYFEKPVPSTILVIAYKHKKIDGRTSAAKALMQRAVVFESKKLYDNEVPDWISKYTESLGLTITPEAAQVAFEFLGNQISTITNEFQKLALGLDKGHRIEIRDVQDGIGISREYNVFELQKALSNRHRERSYTILHHMVRDAQDKAALAVIPSLGAYFAKVYTVHLLHGATESDLLSALGLKTAFFLKEYRQAAKAYQPHQLERVLGLLHDYDLRAKGLGNDHTSDGELLRELLHGILAA